MFGSQHRRLLLATTAVALVALWLYWPTLRLPLIYDTLLHIRITGTLDWRTVWLPTEAFGFYRPLTFAPMLLIEQLFGHYPTWLLHGLNVAQHALNGALLVWLAWRLWQNGRLALAAGLIFVLFPFSYQAVAVYGHNVHPTTTGLILLGLHAYLSAWRTQRTRWWTVTGLLFALSLLSHESAVLFGGFAALLQWNNDKALPDLRPSSLHPRCAPWLIFLLLGVAYLVGYQFLPISRAPQAGLVVGGGLWPKVLYLLQAAVFPLAWLGNKIPDLSAGAIVGGATAVLLLWIGWAARRRQNRLPLLLAAGWCAAAYLLIAIPLSTDYLLHGPRLLYLGSVGVALLWALLLEQIATAWPRVGALPGWTAVLATIMLSSLLFLRGRLAAYAQLTEPVAVVENTLADRPPDNGVLLLNLPQWLDTPRNAYPVGVEFVSMLGDYLFVEELVRHNLHVPYPAWAAVLPDQLAQTAYPYGLHAQSELTAVPLTAAPRLDIFLTRYTPTGTQTTHTGRIGGETTAVPLADFGIYRLTAAQAVVCNDATDVALTWQMGDEAPTATTSLFVQLLDGSGRLVAQADGPPLALPPLLLVGVERPLTDLRTLPTDDKTPATLLIGVYDFATGRRFPAVDAAGNPLPDNALRLPVGPCPDT